MEAFGSRLVNTWVQWSIFCPRNTQPQCVCCIPKLTQYNHICKVIRRDLQAEADDIFVTFDPVPLGAASVAQWHKATLADGTPVAVKVQHPRVKPNSSFVDITTMEFLVNCADSLCGVG